MSRNELRASTGALSADLDGEASPLERGAAQVHLHRCRTCQAWMAAVQKVNRSVRLQQAIVPDLTDAILERLGVKGRRSSRLVRLSLVVMGTVNAVLALPQLLDLHLRAGLLEPISHPAGRELAAFLVTLGAAFLLSAWDGQVRGRLSVVAVGVAVLTFTGLTDMADSDTHLRWELTHLPSLIGFALLWGLRRAEGTSRPVFRRAWVA